MIIYSCIKGNDYTKYLFNKNDKYHSTLIKLSRIEKNNKVDIERFIIDNNYPEMVFSNIYETKDTKCDNMCYLYCSE